LPRFTPQHLLTLANLGLPADKKLEECATFPSDRYFFFILRRMEMSSWVPDIFYSLSIHIPCTLLVTAELYHHPLNCIVQAVLRIRSRCLFDPWIRVLGWVKNQDPESEMGKKSGFGSGINNPDHISESLETIFCVKILKFFDVDPGSGMEKIRTREPGWNSDPGSGINIPDPQHCLKDSCFSSTSTGN